MVHHKRTMEHLQQIIIIHAFFNPLCHMLELLEINLPILIHIINFENSLNTFSGLGISNFCADYFQKCLKVNRFVLLLQTSNNSHNQWIFPLGSYSFQRFSNFNWINKSTFILIKNIKSIPQMIVISSSNSFLPSILFFICKIFSGYNRFGRWAYSMRLCWGCERRFISCGGCCICYRRSCYSVCCRRSCCSLSCCQH